MRTGQIAKLHWLANAYSPLLLKAVHAIVISHSKPVTYLYLAPKRADCLRRYEMNLSLNIECVCPCCRIVAASIYLTLLPFYYMKLGVRSALKVGFKLT